MRMNIQNRKDGSKHGSKRASKHSSKLASRLALRGGLAFAFISGLLLSIILFYEPQGQQPPQKKRVTNLPNFTATQLISELPISSEDLQLPAVINLWASWCTACLYEHPVLVGLNESGIPIYGINYQDNRSAALLWLAENGNPFKLSIEDKYGRLGDMLDVYGLPETLLVDKDGNILVHHRGWITQKVWQDKFLLLWQEANS